LTEDTDLRDDDVMCGPLDTWGVVIG